MKKNFFLLFAASLLCVGQAMADNRVTVSDVNVPQGGQAEIEIGCEFDTEYTGFQLELSLPAGLSLEDGYQVIDKAFDTNHVLTGNLLPSNGNYRFTCRSMDNISIPTSGVLFRVTVVADASLTVGSSLPASITACEFTRTADSQGENLPDVDFTISITESRTILDETSTTPPVAEENANVRVRRTINANEWSTICLPFAMTAEQVKAAFGDDVQIGDFAGCEATTDVDENVVGLNVKFNDVTVIEANHPYIIKVGIKVEEFTADGVDIVVEDELSVDCDEYRTGSGTKKDPYVYHYNSFVGTYTAQTVIPDLCLFISGNQFWYSVGSTMMKGFRGYFDFYDVLASVENPASRISMTFNESTSISDISRERITNNRYYDLQGRRVSESVIRNSELKKGLYIVNDKKVIK